MTIAFGTEDEWRMAFKVAEEILEFQAGLGNIALVTDWQTKGVAMMIATAVIRCGQDGDDISTEYGVTVEEVTPVDRPHIRTYFS